MWTSTWAGDGLELGASANVVRGLAIWGFDDSGINVLGAGDHIVEGNLAGLDCAETGQPGNTLTGILVGSPGNQIGGTAGALTRNIASNNVYGIAVQETLPGVTFGTRIEGNYLGTDSAGTSAQGNAAHGIILWSPDDLVVGGTAPGAGNLISGNAGIGVFFLDLYDAPVGNLVQGNLIGTDVAGGVQLPNGSNGVQLSGGSSNTIGGTSPAARNVISGNIGAGVYVLPGALGPSTGNIVQGNYVGVDANGGGFLLGNGGLGIRIEESPSNIIGGSAAGGGQRGFREPVRDRVRLLRRAEPGGLQHHPGQHCRPRRHRHGRHRPGAFRHHRPGLVVQPRRWRSAR